MLSLLFFCVKIDMSQTQMMSSNSPRVVSSIPELVYKFQMISIRGACYQLYSLAFAILE